MAKAENYPSSILDDLLDEISPKEMRKTEKRMKLAAKIADALEAKGWSKGEFAARMGKNQQSVVTKWLSGTHNFNAETLMDIEEVLEIDLLHLKEKSEAPSITFNVKISSSATVPSSSIYSDVYSDFDAVINQEQISYGQQTAEC